MKLRGASLISDLIPRSQQFEARYRGSVRWSLFLSLSSGLAALFMFLIHVVAVRVLDTASYGEFSSAIALVGIVGVGASSVQAVTVRKVHASDLAEGPRVRRSADSFLLVGVSCLVGCVAYYFLDTAGSTAWMLVLWVPAAVLIARANGEIQGRDLQGLLQSGTSIVTFLSLLVSVVLSLLAASVFTFLLGRLAVTIVFATVLLRSVNVSISEGLLFIHPGLLRTSVVVTTMWFAANMDVLLSRASLDPDSVGEIAIAAMLVNSVLLMPGLIAAVAYPRALAHRRETFGLMKLLIQSVSLALGLQILIALLLFVSRDFLVDWLAGSGHEGAKRVIVQLALAYIPLGASIVVSQFVLAVGGILDGFVLVVVTGIASALLVSVPDSAETFVESLHVVSWFIFFTLLLTVCGRAWRDHVKS